MSEDVRKLWRVKWYVVRLGLFFTEDFHDNTSRNYKDKIASIKKYVKDGGVTDAVVQCIHETVVSETPIGD